MTARAGTSRRQRGPWGRLVDWLRESLERLAEAARDETGRADLGFALALPALVVGGALLLSTLAAEGAELAGSPQAASGTTAPTAPQWAYGLAAVPFFMRDILWVRVLASTTAVVVWAAALLGFVVPTAGLLISMTVVLLVNLPRIIHHLWARHRIRFSREEWALFTTVFQGMSAVQFARLLKIGRWGSAEAGEVLLHQGTTVKALIVIQEGEAAIEQNGRVIAEAAAGAVIGEMSYLQGGTATATARAVPHPVPGHKFASCGGPE